VYQRIGFAQYETLHAEVFRCLTNVAALLSKPNVKHAD